MPVWYREQWASCPSITTGWSVEDQHLPEKSAVCVSESSHEYILWTMTMKWGLEETLTSHMMHSPLVFCQTMHTSTLTLSSMSKLLNSADSAEVERECQTRARLPSPYSDRVHSTVVFRMSVLWQACALGHSGTREDKCLTDWVSVTAECLLVCCLSIESMCVGLCWEVPMSGRDHFLISV